MLLRLFLLLLSMSVQLSCNSCTGKGAGPDTVAAKGPGTAPAPEPEKPRVPNIQTRDLLKTSVTLVGRWVEKDVLSDDKGQWHCSGVVREEKNGVLTIVTNRHCLGLEELSRSEPVGGDLDVLKWQITVFTHNGKELEVTALDVQTDLDLAILRTRPAALVAGRDFLLAPFGKDPVELGDSLIAVGTPLDRTLSGTMTFGRVSSLREEGRVIQHDAAINQGNSGGPLFVVRGMDHFWVGVNTRTVNKKVGEGLHFAISVREIGNGPTITVEVTPEGACKLIRQLHGVGCDAVK
ncbi:S1C family serine protease [Myxococcota bacterium]|jgi:S1-C subfamily serine protease|nr:S1C family serine protease [Myxococcota bacterium]MBU1413852.1 S1C family serine protease [Myxococcota bacterium]MBU1509928.1 S1C family serine protease [Myxococcota bacterium]PKN24191.1 MAG: hypothetical protein CVU65_12500 [Deltaproteobacteria bacterium HGW-Deltaproteobacteria-22]